MFDGVYGAEEEMLNATIQDTLARGRRQMPAGDSVAVSGPSPSPLIIVVHAQGDKDKIVQLEKQTQELQAQMNTQQRAVDLDLQAKCSKDARVWFSQNYQADKSTTLLEFSNHYSKAANRCFIVVQHKFWMDSKGDALSSNVVVYDVYENRERASINELALLNRKDYRGDVICLIENDRKKDVKDVQDCFNRVYAAFMEK